MTNLPCVREARLCDAPMIASVLQEAGMPDRP